MKGSNHCCGLVGALKQNGAQPPTPLKRCVICKTLKPTSEFSKNRAKYDGLDGRCKPCNIKRCREYRLQNLKRERARGRMYRSIHPQKSRIRDIKKNIEDRARDHTTLGPECTFCGSKQFLERHHPDYNKPLQVITTCRSCHQRLHNSGLVLEATS